MEMAPHRWVCLVFLLMLLAEVANAAALRVSTTAVFPAVPCGQLDDDFKVLVRVEAPPAERMRAPIDIVAVLDVSSSMNAPASTSDAPSRLDLLKRGMKFFIDKLHDADRLAVVAFNDEVVEEYGTDLLYMADGGRRDATRHVDGLRARGNTAFWPGLEKAVQILEERAASRDRVGFIVLLSDGIDNSEITWSDENLSKRSKIRAALRRYPVHTFGFSAAHDPAAMLFIAQISRGTYSFVNEDLDRITAAFAVCLGGLKSVVAADARIRLTAAERGGDVLIRSVESGGYRSHVSGDGTSGEIVIGVLYAREVKSFIVRLHVPSAESSLAFFEGRRQQLLLTAAAVSGAVEGGDFGGQSSFLKVQRPGRLDVAAVHQVPSAVVVNHVVRFRLVERVARFVRDEVAAAAAAAAAIDHSSAQELGNRLQSSWEEFKEEHKFWSGVDMSSLENDINAMVSGLQRGGAGAAYICSWLSSYQMQRATTMGSPDKVAVEFLTPEMRTMLQEVPILQPSGGSRPVQAFTVSDLDMIDRRLELWSTLKSDAALMFEPTPAEHTAGTLHRLNAVFRDASIETIDRAMHHDVYLAVVHASNLRRCYSSGGHHAWEEASAAEQRREFASSAAAAC